MSEDKKNPGNNNSGSNNSQKGKIKINPSNPQPSVERNSSPNLEKSNKLPTFQPIPKPPNKPRD